MNHFDMVWHPLELQEVILWAEKLHLEMDAKEIKRKKIYLRHCYVKHLNATAICKRDDEKMMHQNPVL